MLVIGKKKNVFSVAGRGAGGIAVGVVVMCAVVASALSLQVPNLPPEARVVLLQLRDPFAELALALSRALGGGGRPVRQCAGTFLIRCRSRGGETISAAATSSGR